MNIEMNQEEVAKVVYATLVLAIKDLRESTVGDQYEIGFPSSVRIDDKLFTFLREDER